MAGSRIKGITIEIDGSTTKLQKSLQGVNKDLKTTQDNLKDIEKLLKLDPSNTELLAQKQKNLKKAIGETKERLEQLKEAQSKVQKGTEDWDALQREIIDNENQLNSLKEEYRDFGNVASQQIKLVGQKIKDVGGKISEMGEKLAPVSAAAAGIGGAMLKLGYDAVTSADDLNTLSKQTGISTDSLQKMQYAADLVDVSVSDITGSMKKMKSKMVEGNKTFEKLGVSVKDADGNLRGTEETFYDVIKALSTIENETERDQVAMELFGKSADSLAGVIDDGGEALKEYGKQAEEMGLILDGDTLDALNQTNDTIDKVKATTTATLAQVGADVATVLAPVVEKAAEGIGKVTEKLRELTPEQTEIILKIAGVVAVVAPALIILGKIVSGVGALISVIGTVVGVLGGPLTLAIAAIIAVGVLLWKNWDKIKEKFTEIVTSIQNKGAELKDGLTQKFEDTKNNVKQKVENLKSNLQQRWSSIKQDAIDKATSMKNDVVSKVTELKNKAVSKVTELKTNFLGKIQEMKDKVKGYIDDIKGFFANLKLKIPKPELPKLPHFSIKWSSKTILGQTFEYPSGLNVDWWAKAMNNPYVFKSPTIMQTPYGTIGAGEAGDEVMYGKQSLMNDISSAVKANNANLTDAMYVAMSAALKEANLTINVGRREFGRIVREAL